MDELRFDFDDFEQPDEVFGGALEGEVHSNVDRSMEDRPFFPKSHYECQHGRKDRLKSLRKGYNKILNKNL